MIFTIKSGKNSLRDKIWRIYTSGGACVATINSCRRHAALTCIALNEDQKRIDQNRVVNKKFGKDFHYEHKSCLKCRGLKFPACHLFDFEIKSSKKE